MLNPKCQCTGALRKVGIVMIKLISISIPLEVIYPKNLFVLLNVREVKDYVNGVATNNVTCYRYEVVDTDSFEKFFVKVPGVIPEISQEDINNSTKRIKVSFDNAVAKPYRTQTGFYELSIKADSINIMTN